MSVGQIRIMKCWGALFQPRGPPLALFLAILWPLLTQNSHIWLWAASAAPNGLNIGWTWLNIVFHIRGGQLGPFWPPEIVNFGPQIHPKMCFFSLKLPDLVIDSPSSPKWVKYWVNMVEHCISHPGGSVRGSGPFRPPENVNLGPQNRPKCVFRPKMAIFSHKQPKRAILGGSRAPQWDFRVV